MADQAFGRTRPLGPGSRETPPGGRRTGRPAPAGGGPGAAARRGGAGRGSGPRSARAPAGRRRCAGSVLSGRRSRSGPWEGNYGARRLEHSKCDKFTDSLGWPLLRRRLLVLRLDLGHQLLEVLPLTKPDPVAVRLHVKGVVVILL